MDLNVHVPISNNDYLSPTITRPLSIQACMEIRPYIGSIRVFSIEIGADHCAFAKTLFSKKRDGLSHSHREV